MNKVMHISGIVIRSRPDRLHGVFDAVNALPHAEIAIADPDGRVVVTLETSSEIEIVSTLNDLQLLDGVVSAALVYHQIDDDASQCQLDSAGKTQQKQISNLGCPS